MIMCQSEEVTTLDPLSWREDCVLGQCTNCPRYETECPADRLDDRVTVGLWGKQWDPIKKKDTNNLHNMEMSLGELVDRFDSSLPKLRKHVYVAYHQWSACREAGANLKTDTILSIEDYQMNLGKDCLFLLLILIPLFLPEIKLSEETTTAHFSGNITQVACYPVLVKWQDKDGVDHKGGMIFLTSDLKHDHQQECTYYFLFHCIEL